MIIPAMYKQQHRSRSGVVAIDLTSYPPAIRGVGWNSESTRTVRIEVNCKCKRSFPQSKSKLNDRHSSEQHGLSLVSANRRR